MQILGIVVLLVFICAISGVLIGFDSFKQYMEDDKNENVSVEELEKRKCLFLFDCFELFSLGVTVMSVLALVVLILSLIMHCWFLHVVIRCIKYMRARRAQPVFIVRETLTYNERQTPFRRLFIIATLYQQMIHNGRLALNHRRR